jgi:hypothetical protein
MQDASFFRTAMIVPRTEKAKGSLNTALLINSISWPGVKPTSKILLEEGCEPSIPDIIPVSPNFKSAAVLIYFNI